MGWFTKKMQNSRVYMCIKEVKWDLEQADNMRRATILALAQVFRIGGMDSFPVSFLDKPFEYSRNDLMIFYSNL